MIAVTVAERAVGTKQRAQKSTDAHESRDTMS